MEKRRQLFNPFYRSTEEEGGGGACFRLGANFAADETVAKEGGGAKREKPKKRNSLLISPTHMDEGRRKRRPLPPF